MSKSEETRGVSNSKTSTSSRRRQVDASVSEGEAPKETENRARWSNKCQFLLTVVGYSVGLGNIWRFPKVAYENGGGAFLIPYLICSFCFGMPGLYFEFLIGQYTSSSAAKGFKKFAPLIQGLGWSMCLFAFFVSVYYYVIIAWVMVYMYKTVEVSFSGQGYVWSSCRNEWNTDYCQSSQENAICSRESGGNLTYFYNNTCHSESFRGNLTNLSSVTTHSSAEEFYENYILQMSSGMEDIGGMNWPVFWSLFLVWTITSLSMMFGLKIMGYVSYITSIAPFLIIAILFGRGISLDGADIGIKYYISDPEFSKLYEYQTWAAALTQVFYSMGIGSGVLIAMGSYNDKRHNCYRDALLVSVLDSFMSIFGGVAAFSILGYLSKQLNVPISQVIKTGTGLAFIVYPEAMAQMEMGWLWALLFFIMLFLLGVGSQFGYVSLFTTSFIDTFPNFFGSNPNLKAIPCACLLAFAAGIILCTKGGLYYFVLFDQYFGAIGMCLCAVLEFMGIMYIYGFKNFHRIPVKMFGEPKNILMALIGPTGYWFTFNWTVLSPICGIIVLVISCMNEPLTYGEYRFPEWTNSWGWLISFSPAFMILIFGIVNFRSIIHAGKPAGDVLKPQSDLHPPELDVEQVADSFSCSWTESIASV